MSRIGEMPIEIPGGVDVRVDGRTVIVKGKQGELALAVPEPIAAAVEDGRLVLTRPDDTKISKSRHGLARSLAANAVEGVVKGFSKDILINGVGYRAQVQGQTLSVAAGFSSPVQFRIPEGITITVDDPGTTITVSGADKQKVGDAAARIRGFAPVEPYKGKGLQYRDERVRRKVGKTVA